MDEELFEQMRVAAQDYAKSNTRFKETSEMAASIVQKIKNTNPKELWEQMFSDAYRASNALKEAGVLWELSFSHKSAPYISFTYEEESGGFRAFYNGQRTGHCVRKDNPYLVEFDASIRHPQDMHEHEITAALRNIIFKWNYVFSEAIKGVTADLQKRTADNNAQIKEVDSHIQKWENIFSAVEKDDTDREDR